MPEFKAPLRDIQFVMNELLEAEKLYQTLPGYEEARVTLTWPQLGVRLSRRIEGLYRLRDEDLSSSRQFADGIARLGVYFPDWGPNYKIKGLRYDVPYRCLVPKEVEQLLIAGRCISSEQQPYESHRAMIPIMAIGEAAGTAAALAAREGVQPRELNVALLQQTLIAQGAELRK